MFKTFLSAAAFAISVPSVHAMEITTPKGVVEVFTSQGCHSCPPADEFVGQLADENEILALAWHVDYWDYLGWKDTFGSRENTQRQYSYAKALNERQVYTPQAVINGRTHAVGSSTNKIRQTVDIFDNVSKGLEVPVNVEMVGEGLSVAIEKNPKAKDSTLYMVFYNEQEKVKIERGENKGKTITYHNIVRDIQPIGMVNASGLEMNYPLAELKRSGFTSFALILQKMSGNGNPGPIIGATIVSDLPAS